MIKNLSEAFVLPNYPKNSKMWNEWLDLNQTVLNAAEINVSSYWQTTPNYILTYSSIYDIYITHDPDTISPYFNTQSSSILKNYKQIPKLFLIKGQRTQAHSSMPKDIAHYMFVASALNKHISFNNPDDHESIREFIVSNKSKLDKIRSIFSKEPQEIGSGADGIAYDIGNGFILKLFFSTNAYNHAVNAINRLHSNPTLGKTEAMIYDAGLIGDFRKKPVYYYIIEKMETIRNSEINYNVDNLITSLLDLIKNDINHWNTISGKMPKLNDNTFKKIILTFVEKYKQRLSYICKEDISTINKEKINVLQYNWLDLFIEEVILKILTRRADLHTGNIGITSSGYLRFFDPVKDDLAPFE